MSSDLQSLGVPDAGPHKKLSSNFFFWSVLEMKGKRRRFYGKRGTEQLGYQFESVLPVPIEDIQAAYVRMPSVKNLPAIYVACGMKRNDLEQRLAPEGELTLLSLTPTELPDFVQSLLGDSAVDVSATALNLLKGEYEPKIMKVLRTRWLVSAAAALICLSLLVVAGAQRRAAHLHEQAMVFKNVRADVLTEVLGAAASLPGSNADLQLLAELRTLRATRNQPLANLTQEDCSILLAEVLKVWPGDLHIQTESIVVSPENITIRAVAPTTADVQQLADSMKDVAAESHMANWQLQQPQINAAKDQVQTTIQIKNNKEVTK